MHYKRIGQALICLVLVCALLVNVSPLKAHALEPVSTAVGLGIVACLTVAAVGGMVLLPRNNYELESVGNAFSTYLYQWGTSAEKLDEVDAFFGGLTLLQSPSGGDGDDDDDDWSDFRFAIPKALQRAIAGFTAGAIFANSVVIETDPNDSETVVPAPENLLFYNGTLAPDISGIDAEYPYLYLFPNGENGVKLVATTTNTCFTSGDHVKLAVCHMMTYLPRGSGWVSGAGAYDATPIIDDLLWASTDVLYRDGTVFMPGTEPSVESNKVVVPYFYVGDIPDDLKDGSISEENLSVPDTIDYSSIAAANPDLSAGVMDYLGQVANGTVTYEDMISTIVPEAVPEPEPEPEPDPEPSEETFPAIVPDAGQDTVGNTNANTFLQEVTDIVTTPFKWIWENLDTKLDTLSPPEFDFDKLGDYVTAPAEWIWPKLQTFFEPLLNPDTLLAPLPDILEVPFRKTWEYVQEIPQEIADASKALQTKIEAIPEKLAELGTKIQAIPDKIAEAAAQVKAAIGEAVEKAVVPEKDYLTGKVNALREEFVFADSIVRTGEALQLGLAGISTTPPVIYIHLGDTEGSYNIGGTVPFLDLRWYARYKPTVDTLISAFLWICFVWRMLVKLPGIISGMPGDFVMASAHQMGVTDYLPTRSKEYEIQRISNRETIRKGPGK